jgi:hypothetical protein
MGYQGVAVVLTAGWLVLTCCDAQPTTASSEEQNKLAAERIKAGAPVFDTRSGMLQ